MEWANQRKERKGSGEGKIRIMMGSQLRYTNYHVYVLNMWEDGEKRQNWE
jgi:hypothetical protein